MAQRTKVSVCISLEFSVVPDHTSAQAHANANFAGRDCSRVRIRGHAQMDFYMKTYNQLNERMKQVRFLWHTISAYRN